MCVSECNMRILPAINYIIRMGFRDKEDPVEEYLRAYASYVYIAWMQYLNEFWTCL